MPCTIAPEVNLAVTIVGTTITVSSTTNVWPGQIGWISKSGQTTRRVKVVSLLSGATFTARYEPRIGDDNFAKNSQVGLSDAGYPGSSTCNDLSAYTGGNFYAESQPVSTLGVDHGALDRFVNMKVIDAAGANNMTGTSTVLSTIIDTWQFNSGSLEIQITGTPNGALTLEGSNQYDPITNAGATFVTLPSSAMVLSLPVVNGNAVSYLGSVATSVRYIRLRYVNATGTGQLNAWFNGTGA